MAEQNDFNKDHLTQDEIEWRNVAALMTQIQSQLSQVDFQKFISQCELKANEVANAQADIRDSIRKKAAIEAFREKAKVLRVAHNNLGVISIEFKKKHGKKSQEQDQKPKLYTNGQNRKEDGNGNKEN